ncbi:ATP-binding protein, partial [Saccharothrix sp. MB29]|nr:ATP-binding protein [Saccharothrix sp. MB29]
MLESLIWLLRTYGAEDATVEVKRAGTNKHPDSCIESLSAFANTPGGGILLLGVDENDGFAITGVPDAAKLQHDLAEMARTRLSPPLQIKISL